MHIVSFDLSDNPGDERGRGYDIHYTDKAPKSQRDSMTCPRSHCKLGMEPGLKVVCSGPQPWSRVRFWRHREWDPGAGNSWTWDPGLQSCKDCVSRRRPRHSPCGCCFGDLWIAESREGKQWVRQRLLRNASPVMLH